MYQPNLADPYTHAYYYPPHIPFAGVLLQDVHLALHAALLPLYAYLQPIYGRGGNEVRHFQGRMAWYQTHTSLQPLGWLRL